MEGMDIKRQENKTTKQITTPKFYTNKIHAKKVHHGEERMSVAAKYLHYRIKVTLMICKACATAKSKHKLLHKVVEECNLEPVKMIYIDIIP